MNMAFTPMTIDESHCARLERLYADYRRMYNDPANCSPKFIISVPTKQSSTMEECLADPATMLAAELAILQPHLAIADDRVPTVRVQFGTAQVPAAFGCELAVPTDSLPAASTHVAKTLEDVYALQKPTLDAGWYAKLADFTSYFLGHLPEGVHIQHPDIQSAFNNAHLIRGNDILTDFYDDPDAVDHLLNVVTDYMIDLTFHLKAMISADREWFFDWGALWKGTARISNCSMHMISPDFYIRHVLPCDTRFLQAIGGGRIHYCGTFGEVIREFARIPGLSGLDYDSSYHDRWELSALLPPQVTICQSVSVDSVQAQRLLQGDWPAKRNIVICASASSVEEGKELLARFRQSVPGGIV